MGEMSDSNSREIFKTLFAHLAEDYKDEREGLAGGSPQVMQYTKVIARKMWKETRLYDFSTYALEDEDLITLGLARKTDEGTEYRTWDLGSWEA